MAEGDKLREKIKSVEEDPEKTRRELLLMEAKGRERKREMWMWFAGLMVCVVALTIVAVVMVDYWERRHAQEHVTKRVKFEACQSIETETARVVCVNGWGK